jgi:hypothetical protein
MAFFAIYLTLALATCAAFWRVGRALVTDAEQGAPALDPLDRLRTGRARTLTAADSDIDRSRRRRQR